MAERMQKVKGTYQTHFNHDEESGRLQCPVEASVEASVEADHRSVNFPLI